MLNSLRRFFQRVEQVEPEPPTEVGVVIEEEVTEPAKKRKKSKRKNGFGKTDEAAFLTSALRDLFTLRLTSLTQEEFSNLCDFAGVLEESDKKRARQYFAGKELLKSRGSGYYIAGDYGDRAPKNSIRKWRGMQLWGIKRWGLQQHFYTPREITGKWHVIFDPDGNLCEALPSGEVAAMMNASATKILLQQGEGEVQGAVAFKKIAKDSVATINAETGLSLQSSTLDDYFVQFGINPQECFVEIPAASPAHLLNPEFLHAIEGVRRNGGIVKDKADAIKSAFQSITGEVLPGPLAIIMAKGKGELSFSGPGMELVSRLASGDARIAKPETEKVGIDLMLPQTSQVPRGRAVRC